MRIFQRFLFARYKRGRRDLVEAREEGDVEVAEVEQPRIARGNRERAAAESVLEPDAILKKERNEADDERQIKLRFIFGQSRRDRAGIAFKKQRVGVAVEMQPGLVPVGGEGGAGEVAVFVERTKEGVDAFSGGEAQVHVEIQARGGDAEFVRARVVVGDGAAPVAADKQIGEDKIFCRASRSRVETGLAGKARGQVQSSGGWWARHVCRRKFSFERRRCRRLCRRGRDGKLLGRRGRIGR